LRCHQTCRASANNNDLIIWDLFQKWGVCFLRNLGI
jgi:hypothetical protein